MKQLLISLSVNCPSFSKIIFPCFVFPAAWSMGALTSYYSLLCVRFSHDYSEIYTLKKDLVIEEFFQDKHDNLSYKLINICCDL